MDQRLPIATPVSPSITGTESTESPLADTAKRQQTLRSRLFWFLIGAVVNYLLISTPFNYLKLHTALSLTAISACSIGVSAVFFFAWNYFVNFRGDSRRRDALTRYVVVVIAMWAISTSILTLLKHFNFHLSLSFAGRFPIDLDIVATQFFFGGFKFLVYHRWVFPLGDQKRPSQ